MPYLMESMISNLQYVDKKETLFNIRWNNHRKDVKKLKAILADIHFQKNGHKISKHIRFTIIDWLTNTNQEILKESLIQRENFWIQKLETLYPEELDQEFNM